MHIVPCHQRKLSQDREPISTFPWKRSKTTCISEMSPFIKKHCLILQQVMKLTLWTLLGHFSFSWQGCKYHENEWSYTWKLTLHNSLFKSLFNACSNDMRYEIICLNFDNFRRVLACWSRVENSYFSAINDHNSKYMVEMHI